jgi:bifunctional enzyme CysN/CysC
MGLTVAPPSAGEDMLRFITCGSVDDGKSTLIGRLLFDAKVVPEDHLMALTRDGSHYRAFGDMPDLALLVDGLQAEREQGITIDVGYRFFSTPRRRFIIADTPGHEQYTRNMATGASTADLAVILVDATKGLLRQTYRHSAIVALMGIQHVVLAVNKMDLVDYQEERFGEIVAAYATMAERLGLAAVTAITWRASAPGRAKAGLSASRCSGSTTTARAFAATPAPCWAAASGRAMKSSSCRRACADISSAS